MSNGQISTEVKELLKQLYTECYDTHQNSYNNDEGEKLFMDYFC